LARPVRHHGAYLLDERRTGGLDRDPGQDRARRIFHDAGDAAVALGVGRSRKQQQGGRQQDEERQRPGSRHLSPPSEKRTEFYGGSGAVSTPI
jgi:hypothetical protein